MAALNIRTVDEGEEIVAAISRIVPTLEDGQQRRGQGVLASAQAHLENARVRASQALTREQERQAEATATVPAATLGTAATQGYVPPRRISVEPWMYRWADLVAGIAAIAAVLSVIGGIALGIVLSRYTTIDSLGFTTTHHHGDVIVYWVAAGVLTAAVCMALGVALKLLADIGASLRRMAPPR